MTREAPLPFRPLPFLMRMLACVFLFQGGVLLYSYWYCSQWRPGMANTVSQRCPTLAKRSETLFEITITTTLSLMVGTSAGFIPSSSSGPKSASSSRGALPQSPAGPGQPQVPQAPGDQGPASGSPAAFQNRQKKKERDSN